METVTLKITESIKDKIMEFYHDFRQDSSENYVIFSASFVDVKIKIFQNKKGELKACFFGKNALQEALIFDENAKVNTPKEKKLSAFITFNEQIGSDEVGVGDLFGPIVVVASYVNPQNETFLKKLGIMDSKKIKDEKIMIIAPQLINKIPYSILLLENQKLNEKIENGEQRLLLETLLHNQAHLNVRKKIKKDVPVFVDQFLNPTCYFKYLGNSKRPSNITFQTKGESYYPSIAVSSIIARYRFLKYMEQLDQKFNTHFPLGAGLDVDKFLQEFLKTHSYSETKNLLKANFKNFKALNN